MYTITLRINTSEDIQGIKEAIAMDMEKYGDVEVVEVKEDLVSRAKREYENMTPEDFETAKKRIQEGLAGLAIIGSPGSSGLPFYLRCYGQMEGKSNV